MTDTEIVAYEFENPQRALEGLVEFGEGHPLGPLYRLDRDQAVILATREEAEGELGVLESRYSHALTDRTGDDGVRTDAIREKAREIAIQGSSLQTLLLAVAIAGSSLGKLNVPQARVNEEVRLQLVRAVDDEKARP